MGLWIMDRVITGPSWRTLSLCLSVMKVKSKHLIEILLYSHHEKFQVIGSFGKRYAVSAIPSMQKLLNKEHQKQKKALKELLSPTNYALS